MSEALHETLARLAEECDRDDARATKAPWIWTDKIFLWNEEIDCGVLEHGGVEWPMSADNRDVIAAARNRLPELARVLRDAARRIDLLSNLAVQDAPARDRLRTRVVRLEAALAEALDIADYEVLDIADYEASEHQGKPEHLTRLPQLRAVLAEGKEPR